MTEPSTIYRYEIPIQERVKIDLPKDAQFLDAQAKDPRYHLISMWFVIPDSNITNEFQSREFRVFGTGNPINDPLTHLTYLSTVQTPPYVWHIFEFFEWIAT